MVRCSTNKRRSNLFHDKPRPMWKSFIVYGFGLLAIGLSCMWILRDTTPIHFVPPSIEDMKRPRGELATRQELDNVYWRVTLRSTSTNMEEICKDQPYHLITNKNIRLDGQYMPQSYIFLCNPIDGIQSILNARAVVPRDAEKSVRCIETYGNTTKEVVRGYPFSLKYISTQTFEPSTRVVRAAEEACTWLHAIDIVESIWD
jgi:hypothetical protein